MLPHNPSEEDDISEENQLVQIPNAQAMKLFKESIKNLVTNCQNSLTEKDFDAQGVYIVNITKAKLKKELGATIEGFPNLSEDGIDIIVYKPGFHRLPPLQYLIKQRILSLVKSYNLLHNENINVEDFWNENFSEDVLKQIATDLAGDPKKIIKDQVGKCFSLLYMHKKQDKSFKTFAKKLLIAAESIRSDDSQILTINQETQTFSYDGFVKDSTTAHDRHIRTASQKAPNLSLCVEGSFTVITENDKKIVDSVLLKSIYTKSASLAAIRDLKKDPIDVLMDACNSLEDAAIAQGDFFTSATTLNLFTAILTSNIGDFDKQATTYQVLVDAQHAMHGATITLENKKTLTLNNYISNAGINTSGGYDLNKKDTQRRENRRAHEFLVEGQKPNILKISDLLEHLGKNELKKNLEKFNKILTLPTKLQEDINTVEADIKLLAANFQKERARYNAKNLSKDELKEVKLNIKNINATLAKAYRELASLTYQAEQYRRRQFEKHFNFIDDLLDALFKLKDQFTPDSQEQHDYLVAFLDVNVQFEIDQLYYSDKYRQPENAVVFHTLCERVQRLRSLSTPDIVNGFHTNCKSGNDRTGKQREYLATFGTLDVEKIDSVRITMAGVAATIKDTGGTPKVDKKRFPFARDLTLSTNVLNKFSGTASHQLKNKLSAMEKVFEEMFVTKKKSLLEEINNENCTYEEAEKIIKKNEHILNKHTTMVGKFCAAYHITLFNLHRTNIYQKALEILDSKPKLH